MQSVMVLELCVATLTENRKRTKSTALKDVLAVSVEDEVLPVCTAWGSAHQEDQYPVTQPTVD